MSSMNLNAGDKLAGAYTLKNPLEGETGLPVWLAHDDELDRDVTLHFLPDAVRADPRAMSELRAAVRRNRQLIHPRILRVHDLIEEEKWAAITMDHVEGESLAGALRATAKQHFEVDEIAPWVAQICQTIEDAHKIELFHGDLAPVNVIVGKSGDLHVANFGLSRIVLDVLARAQQPVRGEGDLAYASPQQLDGERLGKSDDLYALGVVIYELLTGKPPFHSGDLLSEIRRKTAPSVGERRSELQVSGEPVPPAWEKTISACLEKNADSRPKSAREVAASLSLDKPVAAGKSSERAASSAKEVSEKAGTATAAHADDAGEKQTAKDELALHSESSASVLAAKVVSKPPVPAREGGLLAERDERGRDYGFEETPGLESAGEGESGEGASGPKPVPGKHFPRSSFLGIPQEGQGQSRGPRIAFAVAAILVIIGIAGFLLPHSPQKENDKNKEGTEVQPANVPESEKPVATNDAKPTPVPVVTSPTPKKNATVAGTNVVPQVPLDGRAKLAQAEQQAVEKARLAANAKKTAEAAGGAHGEKKKLQERAETVAQQAQKAADERAMAAAAVKKSSEDVLATRKMREDARDKAEAEASEAAKVAADKARLADDAKKAALDIIQQTNEQVAQQQKADNEVQDLQKVAQEKQQLAAAAAKVAMEAESIYKQQLANVKLAEDEAAQAQSNVQRAKAAEEARQAAAEAEQLRMASEQEAQKLEAQAAQAEKAAAEAKAMVLRARERAGKEAERLRKAREEASKKAGTDDGAPASKDPKPSASILPENLAPEPTKLVLKTETKMESPAKPSKVPSVSVRVPEARATVGKTLQNSLGMKFAPVGETLFSTVLTRVKDFEAFAKATNLKASSWRRPDFPQGPDHPAVNVNWIDAIAFCKWLSEKEQKEGSLSTSQLYRLPTDLEWSRAVGLPDESGRSPEDRDMGIADIYPWGTQWPPPPGSGNYTGEETNSDVAIKGYHDGFPYTSPVGAFPANKLGLYDMGGNVWQWCMDWWNKDQKSKTLRGASWYNGALKMTLLSSCRINSPPEKSSDNYGFRVVLAPVEAGGAKR